MITEEKAEFGTKVVQIEKSSEWAQICEEMKETEERYAEFLRMLLDDFWPPIATVLRKQIIIHVIFANARQLLNFSEEFQSILAEAIPAGKVGNAYRSISPFYKLYSEYSNNHGEAIKEISELSASSRVFRDVVHECELVSGKGQTLLSLLIMPIQRVPRHILMLEALCNAIPPGHEDYPACAEALNQMMDVGQRMNESLRQKENSVKVWEIQSSLHFGAQNDSDDEEDGDAEEEEAKKSPNLFERGRAFVKEGEVFKICKQKYRKRRKLFLFNDCLVYARPCQGMKNNRKKKWTFRGRMKVSQVQDLPDGSPLALGESNAFLIVGVNRNIVCFAGSIEEKFSWMTLLHQNVSKKQTQPRPLSPQRMDSLIILSENEEDYERDTEFPEESSAQSLVSARNALQQRLEELGMTQQNAALIISFSKSLLRIISEFTKVFIKDAREMRTKTKAWGEAQKQPLGKAFLEFALSFAKTKFAELQQVSWKKKARNFVELAILFLQMLRIVALEGKRFFWDRRAEHLKFGRLVILTFQKTLQKLRVDQEKK